MNAIAHTASVLVAATSLAAGLVGAWHWWRRDTGRAAWAAIRTAQVVAGIGLVAALTLLIAGFRPEDDLYWIYVSLPVGVGFFAEQIRISIARAVLDGRDLADGEAVARLPAVEQRDVVIAILRRELGVMAVAAVVSALLALRALGTI